jgi:hypothetical protein
LLNNAVFETNRAPEIVVEFVEFKMPEIVVAPDRVFVSAKIALPNTLNYLK